MSNSANTVHLRSGGVSLVITRDHWGMPVVAHWGAELADADLSGLTATAVPAVLNSSLDAARSFSLIPTIHHGWSGTPGLEWSADGFASSALRVTGTEETRASATFRFRDDNDILEATLRVEIDEFGLVRLNGSVANLGVAQRVRVRSLVTLLPLPARAQETLDFTGKWSGERRPQRRRVADGTWLRTSRRGRPGHDSAYLTMVGTTGFTALSGEIWACHVAWSGNQQSIVERSPEGAGVHSVVLGGGEALDIDEIVLKTGEVYRGPDVWFAWGGEGIDDVSARFHDAVRHLPSYPARPRPLVLNTWEAVYFDHDRTRLAELADKAASVGVERFVLDDGWFLGRRDDSAGLGDWVVDESVWPTGLSQISQRVHDLGMEFGLWFEPEMVNPDSSLAREHPDWILGERPELSWRNQFVVDLANPAAFDHVLGQIDAVVTECGVDFIKWDHNRDLHAAQSTATGRPGVHEHTMATYRMLDELGRRHPHLEIESCASGGARPDLGILSRTQRLWASDTNDPYERQWIQRWTQALLPPELVGSHVGPAEAHTTHRTSSLSFRLVTALFGHAGLEWDLLACTDDELASITRWGATYKELRPLLHAGRSVHAEAVDAGASLAGVVSPDRRHAIFAWVRTETSPTAHTPRVPMPGLDALLRYRVTVRSEAGLPQLHQISGPAWLDAAFDGVVLTGRVLVSEGLPLPLLNPGNAMLFELVAVG
ncbi:alpha-galactosidase [Herbiconiux solani]|uniref:alpha-galactosidase n=1 Tax=Herbiconiux solani TaxID=661329 RepID=UPI0008249778|nr:alpha-galactosidase [Herbiconiux solani]